MQRQYQYPWEPMFGEFTTSYTQPYQTRYHNLGMNGYVHSTFGSNSRTVYPGKRYGLVGDYGPRQQGCYNYNGAYPLDTLVMESQGIDPNSKKCGLIKNATNQIRY